MKQIRSYKGLLYYFENLPDEIKEYYKVLRDLLKDYHFSVSLAYLFSLLERGHHMALYCSIVKLHKTDKILTRTALENHHFIRKGFQEMCERVLGKRIPTETQLFHDKTAKVRDKLMHGKDPSDDELRNAIANGLEYSRLFNEYVYSIAGFNPFTPSLRGVFGRMKTLDKKASRWMLIGMGLFNNKDQEMQ